MTEQKIQWTISYVLHLILACVGMLLCMILFAKLPARLDPLRGPYFWGPIAFGTLAGIFVGRKAQWSVLAILWVLPALLLAYEVHIWSTYRYSNENLRQTLLDNFVRNSCGASECMEEGLVVSPLISTFCYSLAGSLTKSFSKNSDTLKTPASLIS
ncbi:MAG: hypothetical protein WBY53_08555 [Acidobacteriaceae bacterium]